MSVLNLMTVRGAARLHLHAPRGRRRPRALAVLLHGAGTSTEAGPLPGLAVALAAAGALTVRLDQPYVVAGRRAPDRAPLLDAVLTELLPLVRAWAVRGAPLVLVGRSSGARVACRVVAGAQVGPVRAVVVLGFPFRPPQGRSPTPRPDRGAELRAAGLVCPVLVLQGGRDPFGQPLVSAGVQLELFAGTGHTPSQAMADRAADWAATQLGLAG